MSMIPSPSRDEPAGPVGRPVEPPPGITDARLARQIAFLLEIDQLKSVLRQSHLIDRSRRENDAEHSWHLAMLAVVLGEYAAAEVDQARVVRMLLIHDLVEVYAGDTFLYDTQAAAGQAERERAAADRLFPQLPGDQADELRALWEEFEARRTPDARFARALDRVQPLLLNFYTGGSTWRPHGVTRADVLNHQKTIEDGSPALWEYVRVMIDEAVRRGYLRA
ncbi:putative HD superfamily hydrolase [Frankia torreyi]|uniref:Putative HD superfamily hydrolase n=2 Tax=Frankiaceae TaxID=74712 RepID=A0A0D8BJG8_9ACTN|nr:putative HD superfamily hydrolase [Frankia torreyi]KQM06858.1 putative HD superfamily hydrolase [Frankia sp. CpI1-P]